MNREERRAFAHENGVPMPPPAETPQSPVPLQPLPVATGVGMAEIPGVGNRVLLQIWTPMSAGPFVFFLEPAHARVLAGELELRAGAAAAGLILPESNGHHG